jgi:mono/diheme cytochrome c family protein
MQMKIGTTLIAALMAVTSAAWRPAFAEESVSTATLQPGDRDDARMVAEGRTLYAHHCSHCHGFNMVNPGTIAYDLRQFPHDQKSRFVHSVTNGKNGRMPQWGDVLTLEDIDKL